MLSDIPFCKVISSRAALEPTQVAPNSKILQGSISVTTIIIARSRVQFSSLQQPQMVSFTRIFYPVWCNRQQINQNTANSSQRSKHHSILHRRHVGFRDVSTSGLSGIHFYHAAQKYCLKSTGLFFQIFKQIQGKFKQIQGKFKLLAPKHWSDTTTSSGAKAKTRINSTT